MKQIVAKERNQRTCTYNLTYHTILTEKELYTRL